MNINENTPVIIGVGEASERIDAPSYRAMSPADLAAAACTAALDDPRAKQPLAAHVDTMAAIRQFEVSGPRSVAPFGKADNFPRAVAKRIGANPSRAILEPVGGQGPQHLVNELCHTIARGKSEMALIFGSEAISTVRHLTQKGEMRDWNEEISGQLEDRGFGFERLMIPELATHGASTAILLYALFENARRAKLGLDRKAYQLEMGKLFAPFTRVASANPHAMSQEVFSAEELAAVTERNRLVADPFPRRMVSRDQANQGAAVMIASLKKVRELGVPEDRLVYLHGGADTAERTPLDRNDLAGYPAAGLAGRRAIELAGIKAEELAALDLYSCFPIAVSTVRDELGISPQDKRSLTMTGGLPFFGGAGNNYSMHAIASMVRALRKSPGACGFVGANGGFLSKYSVGVYSTTPKDWKAFDSGDLQRAIDSWPAPPRAPEEADAGRVLTYTIDYAPAAPRATLICGTEKGARFVAATDPADGAFVRRMIEEEPLGASIRTRRDDKGRRIVTEFAPR
jgi:acetyl-CoA C-acetyltransferase